MTIVYKKVILIVGFDPEKSVHPSKMIWTKQGVDIKLSKVEDIKEVKGTTAAVCTVTADSITPGTKVKHSTKGILTAKEVSTPPGMKVIRIVFVDSNNEEAIVFKKGSFEFECAPSASPKKKRVSKAKVQTPTPELLLNNSPSEPVII